MPVATAPQPQTWAGAPDAYFTLPMWLWLDRFDDKLVGVMLSPDPDVQIIRQGFALFAKVDVRLAYFDQACATLVSKGLITAQEKNRILRRRLRPRELDALGLQPPLDD